MLLLSILIMHTQKQINLEKNEAKTRRSTDGTWTKKDGKSHFGY